MAVVFEATGGIECGKGRKEGLDTGESEFKYPWCEAGPLNQLGDKVGPDQLVVNKEVSL